MISRAHMRRQLRATGGITNARQGYGIGSWVKERVRKLIPNELADIASKAAPFVAPFYPGAAAAMRGIGRFDKRGSISDAMKQAALTYAGGKGARYLGGAEGATGGPSTYSMKGFREGPVGRTWDGVSRPVDDAYREGYERIFGQKENKELAESYKESRRQQKERQKDIVDTMISSDKKTDLVETIIERKRKEMNDKKL